MAAWTNFLAASLIVVTPLSHADTRWRAPIVIAETSWSLPNNRRVSCRQVLDNDRERSRSFDNLNRIALKIEQELMLPAGELREQRLRQLEESQREWLSRVEAYVKPEWDLRDRKAIYRFEAPFLVQRPSGESVREELQALEIKLGQLVRKITGETGEVFDPQGNRIPIFFRKVRDAMGRDALWVEFERYLSLRESCSNEASVVFSFERRATWISPLPRQEALVESATLVFSQSN